MRLHNSDEYESIKIWIDPIQHPIAFKNRIKSFEYSGMTEEEVIKMASQPIEMELYYDSDTGLFMVEPEAVESGTIYHPYTGTIMDDAE